MIKFTGFTLDGVTYNCSEQYIMRQKCILAGDTQTADKVMPEDDPVKQKNIGKTIKNFNRGVWETQAKALAKEGINAKVDQNVHIKELLLSTGT